VAAKASTIEAALALESGVMEDGHSVLVVIPSLIDDIQKLASTMPAPPNLPAV